MKWLKKGSISGRYNGLNTDSAMGSTLNCVDRTYKGKLVSQVEPYLTCEY